MQRIQKGWLHSSGQLTRGERGLELRQVPEQGRRLHGGGRHAWSRRRNKLLDGKESGKN